MTHKHLVVNKKEKERKPFQKTLSALSAPSRENNVLFTLITDNWSLCWRQACQPDVDAFHHDAELSFARTNLQLHMSKHAGRVGLSSQCATCCNRTSSLLFQHSNPEKAEGIRMSKWEQAMKSNLARWHHSVSKDGEKATPRWLYKVKLDML